MRRTSSTQYIKNYMKNLGWADRGNDLCLSLDNYRDLRGGETLVFCSCYNEPTRLRNINTEQVFNVDEG